MFLKSVRYIEKKPINVSPFGSRYCYDEVTSIVNTYYIFGFMPIYTKCIVENIVTSKTSYTNPKTIKYK